MGKKKKKHLTGVIGRQSVLSNPFLFQTYKCNLIEVKVIYKDANACIEVDGEEGESFRMYVGMRQKCVTLLCLFNLPLELRDM